MTSTTPRSTTIAWTDPGQRAGLTLRTAWTGPIWATRVTSALLDAAVANVRSAQRLQTGFLTLSVAPARAWLGRRSDETASPLPTADISVVTASAAAADLVTGLPEAVRTDGLLPPFDGYAEASLASLRGRLRSLSADNLAAMRAYEVATSNRPDVVSLLDKRIAKLSAAG